MSAQQPTGKIITFYSYKGGTGRSMAVANIAWILASAGKSVLVLDWDLEAPGLHRYFRPFLIDKELASSEGIIDYIIGFCDEAIRPLAEGEEIAHDWYVAYADLTRYRLSIDYEDFPRGGKIDFVPAGQQGPTYATRVNSFNWQDFYQRLGGGAFIDATREHLRKQYDYILVDSRTGVSDTAGICTVQMPDTLAIFFTFNNQSISGAAAVAESVFEQRKDRPQGRHRFRILPVPTRVDQTERDKLDQRKLYARFNFDPFLQQIPPSERPSYWDNVEVPYVPWFAYEEVLSPFRDSAGDPKSVLASMKRITDFLVQPEIETFEFVPLISPERKQNVLLEFAATPIQPKEDNESPSSTESPLEKYIRLAELTYLSLSENEREGARRLWLRLVHVPQAGERVENSKVRVPTEDLTDVPDQVMGKFTAAGVLVTGFDDDAGQPTLEVASEELLRNWKRLLEWIDQDRQFVLWRQLLQRRMAEWKNADHANLLLLIGTSLSEARGWAASHTADINQSEEEYISSSLTRERARQRQFRRRFALAAAAIVILSVVTFSIRSVVRYLRKDVVTEKLLNQAEQIIASSATMAGKQRVDQLQLGILLELETDQISPSTRTEELITKHLSLLPRQVANSPQDGGVQRVAITDSGDRFVAILGKTQSFSGPVEDKVAVVQETTSHKQLALIPFRTASSDLVISDDGRLLAFVAPNGDRLRRTSTAKQTEVVWDLNKRYALSIPISGPTFDAVFSGDNRYLALATDTGTEVFDLNPSFAKQQGVMEPRLSNGFASRGVTFSSNGQYLATLDGNHRVLIKSVVPNDNSQLTDRLIVLDGPAGIELSASGNNLATVDFVNNSVSVWNIATGKRILSASVDHPGDFVFSPDDRLLLMAEGQKIKAWDLTTARPVDLNIVVDGNVAGTFFSLDGRFFTVIGGTNLTRVWRYADGRFDEAALFVHEGIINDLAFSRGNLVATAGSDNAVRVWDLGPPPTNKPEQTDYCARLTRNLTNEEWDKYMPSSETYHQTCRPSDDGRSAK